MSILIEDPGSDNYPSLDALNALFKAQPNGLGVHPVDVFFGNNNWDIPWVSTADPTADAKWEANTGYTQYTCTNLKRMSPQVTQISGSAGAYFRQRRKPGSR